MIRNLPDRHTAVMNLPLRSCIADRPPASQQGQAIRPCALRNEVSLCACITEQSVVKRRRLLVAWRKLAGVYYWLL
jgi:hypothetical protein